MKELEFKFKIEEINVILNALSLMSYKDVYVLINNIQTQVQPQLKVNDDDDVK